MSRAQQGQVFSTAGGQQTTYNNMADTSFGKAEGDIADYASAVNQFKANDPYVASGEAQTAENQQLADTAAGGAQAAGQAIQSAAVRTGQNPAGAIAATEKIAQENQRTLGGQEAAATDKRLGEEATYNEAALQGKAQAEGMQNTVAEEEQKAAQGNLGTEEQAAQTPSFMDELGQGIIQSGVAFAGGAGQAFGKGCWIAAELYGGWYEPRTVLLRSWLFGPFKQTWHGKVLTNFYLRFGEATAGAIRRRPLLRSIFQRVFDRALKHAQLWQEAKRG